jgi:hypothetical protein
MSSDLYCSDKTYSNLTLTVQILSYPYIAPTYHEDKPTTYIHITRTLLLLI